MEKSMKPRNNFVGYEYKDVTVVRHMESLWTDSYVAFGWLLEGRASDKLGINYVNLKFKRECIIRNKVELTRLQRQFEVYAKKIDSLEKSKNIGASAFAYGTGILGTAFMALSVFSYIGGKFPLSIVFAIPGFLGWILPYFGYVKIRDRKAEKVNPIIDEQYDMIYNICTKASRLLEK